MSMIGCTESPMRIVLAFTHSTRKRKGEKCIKRRSEAATGTYTMWRMHKGMFLSFGICVALLNGAGCHSKSEGGARGAAKSPAVVDAVRIVHADDEPGN